MIALQITDRNGRMVGALQVSLDDEIMLMSQNGALVRTPVKDISVVGRNTQGVRFIRLEEGISSPVSNVSPGLHPKAMRSAMPTRRARAMANPAPANPPIRPPNLKASP